MRIVLKPVQCQEHLSFFINEIYFSKNTLLEIIKIYPNTLKIVLTI